MAGSSINSDNPSRKSTIKFLCSYGGRILPSYPDGKLRYHGGETRVLSVERTVTFADLLVKLGKMCGALVTLRCQFPTEDLDALVSITSDEDLANLIEEYDYAAAAASTPSSSLKIRAFLSSPKTTKNSPSPPSPASSSSNDSASPKSLLCSSAAGGLPPRCPTSANGRSIRRASRPPAYPIVGEKVAGKIPHKYACQCRHGQGNGGQVFNFTNHWQYQEKSGGPINPSGLV